MQQTESKPTPAPSLIERMGIFYLQRLSAGLPPVEATDAISVLNPEERKGLRRITRAAVARACLAGALSALASAVAEMLATPMLGPVPESATLLQTAQHWGIVLGVTGVATVFEILFLYWDSLRAVHALARTAGLPLFAGGKTGERTAVAAALARAALELPNPTGQVFGVNPHREASKFRLLIASLLYKLKVTITSFVMKVVVRRLLGRALVRTWLPLIAVPITAAWNGIVAFIVLREARIRAMGPSAATEILDAIFAQKTDFSEQGRIGIARAVASSIVRTEDLHPNLLFVLQEVLARVGDLEGVVLDDSKAFIQMLPTLEAKEQQMALQVLLVAAILDGRFTLAERRLLEEAQVACGRPADVTGAERLRRAFVAGDADLDKLIVQVK